MFLSAKLSAHSAACVPVSAYPSACVAQQGLPPSPAARVSPGGISTSSSMGRHTQPPSFPPVHDVKEILGDRAPVLHVAPKGQEATAAPAAAKPVQQ